jgi:ribosomal protein S18 acetylase RimI-like enzyme
MNIRKAEMKDAQQLAHLHIASWKRAYRGIVSDDILNNLDETRRAAAFEKSFEIKFGETYLIEENGSIRGFTTFGNCRDNDRDENTGEIWGVYISPDHWRMGYGSKLTAYAESVFRSMNKKEIVLWVLKDNCEARSFYEKIGYIVDGKSKILERLDNLVAVRYVKRM